MKLEHTNILLTGGSGRLGRELIKALRKADAKVIAPSSEVLDITDTSMTFQAISWHAPTMIVHCAAYTDVPGAETPEGRLEANRINIHGTKNIAHAAHYFGAKVIHISTDYVYGGTGNHYVGDGTYPTSYYGITKLVAESFMDSEDLVIRTTLKGRGTWGKDAYTKVLHPVRTNGDFADVIAEKITKAICDGMKGTVNLGTEEKFLLDLAVEDYPEVEIMDVNLVDVPYKYPRDCTMKLDI
jgi:dTDP-4-dehydrorhamnose reductase